MVFFTLIIIQGIQAEPSRRSEQQTIVVIAVEATDSQIVLNNVLPAEISISLIHY